MTPDIPDHDCFADTDEPTEFHSDEPAALAIIAGLFLCFCAAVIVGVGIVRGWWW